MPRKRGHSSAETKETIKRNFMEIFRKKNIERITVDELCELSQINRSTFYYYFQDIYDLSLQIEQEFIEIVESIFPHILAGLMQQNFEAHLRILIDFYQKYRDQYLLFIVEKPNQRVLQTIMNFAQRYALQSIGLDKEKLTLQQRLIVEYIAHAQLGLIGWWMENGQAYSVEELSGLITQINMKGPFTTLFQTIEEHKIILPEERK